MTVLPEMTALERSIRLTAGLVMFSFVICHFAAHATGLFLLAGIQGIGHDVLLAPWRTAIGLQLLLASFLTHLGLGLWALYRRRHLRMPALEAWQLGLALTIPLLITPHALDARVGVELYGLEDSYLRVLYKFWVSDPSSDLPRQFALLIIVWAHGCIGIHKWLRFRAWYRRRLWAAGAFAAALPALAILGVVNAGWDTILHAATEPGFAAAHGPPAAGTPQAAAPAALTRMNARLDASYLALLAAVVLLRGLRSLGDRRRGRPRIDYPNGKTVFAPRGSSILEASRWAGIPHASVCGGRGRCSTCRVRVSRGLEHLPPPTALELAALQRIGAPEGVRLACQTRPTSDVSVTPLVSPDRPFDGPRVSHGAGRELSVTALHVDLRDSTRLVAGRLPFDALFIVDRYIQAATGAMLANGGHIATVAGDGIMSVFGLDGDARSGAPQALAAIDAVWRAIDRVSEDLAGEIGSPLRFGVGAHSGPSVVGAVGPPHQNSLQFLGDTGNVAARLEGLTKEMGCVAIVSTATVEAAGWRPRWRRADADIRGRDGAVPVFLIHRREELAADRAPEGSAAAV